MDLQKSILNQTDVSVSVAKHVIHSRAQLSNLVFSPLSIQVVLGLLANASSDGPTRTQFLHFLNSQSTDQLNLVFGQIAKVVLADGSPRGGPRLSIANGVWADRSLRFKPAFQGILDTTYMAASALVDFRNQAEEARKEVNVWAEKKTNGLIKEILQPGSVDDSTSVILANAVYFKGSWNQKFNASKTKNHEFFLMNGSSVEAPFMTTYKKMQCIRAFDGFKVLALRYEQGEDTRRFSMYIYLPDARDGLPALIEKVSSESGFIERHLPYKKVEVGDFRIPKFKISFGFEASEVVKEQGLVLPFSGDGLTEMVDSSGAEYMNVSGILHKSFIEVNKEGTEAAAVTATTMVVGCPRVLERYKIDFVADHPFLFVLREDITGALLFIGQLHNPLAG